MTGIKKVNVYHLLVLDCSLFHRTCCFSGEF